MKELLKELAAASPVFTELRYHKRISHVFLARKGRVDVAHHEDTAGVGVRCQVDGSWGFASTSDLSRKGLSKAIQEAQRYAGILAKSRGKRAAQLARGELATGDFIGKDFAELTGMPLADKVAEVIRIENQLAKASQLITNAQCRYKELVEEKVIVTSDGAAASLKLCQPEVLVSAVAEENGERISYIKSAGVNGGWDCLYQHPSLNHLIDETARYAVDLLKAKYPEGGKKTAILAPSLVGLLCHEAIGHTVEADFVKAGSIAQGKIGQQVASKLVNLYDSGCENLGGYATGNIPFDDEGVISQTTPIIKDGILVSYLHNRETAAEFGVTPTGNARAWLYSDEPLIRMRNTYMLPGTTRFADMLASMDDGYLCEGAGGGQADANGEFMFGCSNVWRIKNGQKKELLREATLAGIAFDVLKTVDAVSQEFLWDLGSGYCGKGQPAKVDAGGPYIRCRIHIGGQA